MNIFDFHKTLLQSSADTLKKLSVFNPLTIRKKGARAKAIFCLALVCSLWGTTWIASKKGVMGMPALQMASMRQIIAGLLYVGFFLYKKVPFPKGKEWIPVLVLSFLNFIVRYGLGISLFIYLLNNFIVTYKIDCVSIFGIVSIIINYKKSFWYEDQTKGSYM